MQHPSDSSGDMGSVQYTSVNVSGPEGSSNKRKRICATGKPVLPEEFGGCFSKESKCFALSRCG